MGKYTAGYDKGKCSEKVQAVVFALQGENPWSESRAKEYLRLKDLDGGTMTETKEELVFVQGNLPPNKATQRQPEKDGISLVYVIKERSDALKKDEPVKQLTK